MTQRQGRVLRSAEFNRKYIPYQLCGTILLFLVTIVTIPLIPIWLVVGWWIHGRQLDRMSLELTERSLEVKQGIMNRVEKSIPLDKVTDLALHQNFLMRMFDLHGLRVETAGQSGPGALVNLVGVVDARGFRDDVLSQRELLASSGPAVTPAASASGSAEPTLEKILAAVERIERHLKAN